MVFGAGGAARAITVETALAGAASITVVNRDADRGGKLSALLNERTPAAATYVSWDDPYAVPESVDIVINATSIGLAPDVDGQLNLDVASLQPEMIVADVIPNPPTTRLLADAAARGCRTLDGLGMLVNQGVLGVKLWTGVDADSTVMYETLRRVLDLLTVGSAGELGRRGRCSGHDRHGVVGRVRLRRDDGDAATETLDVDAVGDLEDVRHVVADQHDRARHGCAPRESGRAHGPTP